MNKKSKNRINLIAEDGHHIPVYYFSNKLEPSFPKAIIQIIHGMCEHHLYYMDFIQYFNEKGFDIFIHDQRGHGNAVTTQKELGFISKSNGGSKLINDGLLISEYIHKNNKDTPLLLFGHSMGALIAQAMACKSSKQKHNYYQKLMLTGSPGIFPTIICKLGKLLINFEIKRQGNQQLDGQFAISPIGNFLIKYGFNFDFRKEKNKFAWVTRDQQWLDIFFNDHKAGFIPKNKFWLNLIYLLEFIKNKQNLCHLNHYFPIAYFDGAVDPVNNKSKQTKNMIKKLKKLGKHNVKHYIYPMTRHHLCIETNREKIFSDMLKFLC